MENEESDPQLRYRGGKIEHYTVNRGLTKFHVTVDERQFEGTDFGVQLDAAKRKRSEYWNGIITKGWPARGLSDAQRDPNGLSLQQCDPIFAKLATDVPLPGRKFSELCRMRTYCLNFGKRADRTLEIAVKDEEVYESGYTICPLRNEEVKWPRSLEVDASRVVLLRDGMEATWGRVKVDGVTLWLKPRCEIQDLEFNRELVVLCRLRGLVGSRSDMRVSKLVRVVVFEQAVVGMLLEWIEPSPYGGQILEEGLWAQRAMHKQWEDQVRATVTWLHAHDIVWGDVNAGNIYIDKDCNAWVIDFGGNYSPDFVDEDKKETVEGDWQGVQRLFQEWLPQRCAEVVERAQSSPH
ncbi:Hypothetical protein D9617_5g071100 [Elsinoe fawcettii]|nr:Hypothetical protein D9617_5g071100 [Elsinoe fawcettii]